jgi:hypothetical protein
MTIRWRATDADNDHLTVALLVRRGNAWQTVTLGPAAGGVAITPTRLGLRPGRRLQLRLLVSDGLTTITLNAKPVTLRAADRPRDGRLTD